MSSARHGRTQNLTVLSPPATLPVAMLNPTDYDLESLAEKFKLSTRKIRYYISIGLLPEAESRGRHSRYGRSHSDRLEMILKLKEEGFSLEEIGRGFRKYRESGMRQYLEEIKARKGETESRAASVNSVNSVNEPPPDALGYSQWAQKGGDSSKVSLRMGFQSQAPPFPSPSEATWKRLPLSPDVEIHVRQPLDSETDRKVAELLRSAEDIFK